MLNKTTYKEYTYYKINPILTKNILDNTTWHMQTGSNNLKKTKHVKESRNN
jgi:hypothetical protein